jgi:hypothetical protein
MANIGIENTDCETLRQLKAIQATNCRKTKSLPNFSGKKNELKRGD